MAESKPSVIRGKIDGREKYCRIPIRSKTAEIMMRDELWELNADTILSMPAEQAAAVIDAIVEDWMYWLRRAGELWARVTASERLESQSGEEGNT